MQSLTYTPPYICEGGDSINDKQLISSYVVGVSSPHVRLVSTR
jgi:hypothetical protein